MPNASGCGSVGPGDSCGVRVSRQLFVITVTGEMDQQLREQFEDVELSVDHSVTRLHVTALDTSGLHGLLHRIEALGLELLDVDPVDGQW